MLKQCASCLKRKPYDQFSVNNASWDGLQRLCKECDKARAKKYYQDNLEQCREKRKQWQDENYELHLEHQNKYNSSEKGKKTRRKFRARKKFTEKEV